MKLIIFISVLLFNNLFAQTNESQLPETSSSQRIKNINKIHNSLVEIELARGKKITKNISDFNAVRKWDYLDSTIIDIENVDTTLFWDKYQFLKYVNIFNYDQPTVGDINNNGFKEIYGWFKEYAGGYSDVYIKELNSQGEFDSVYLYDSTRGAKAIYDINKDGNAELHLQRLVDDTTQGWLLRLQAFYEKETDTSLAKSLSFIFNPYTYTFNNQQDDNTYSNLDGDSLTDMIYINPTGQSHLRISEFNENINNFDSVYNVYLNESGFGYCSGFSIGDFDQDGMKEIIIGSVQGLVIVFENTGDDSYTITWIDTVETYNAYQHFKANDLDSNGRTEFWVGGAAFYNGVPITRYTCFESTGNNQYKKVAKIDFIGIFSWYANGVQSVDIDKDGKNEIFFCFDGYVGILKFIGSPNYQRFELFYLNANDLWGQNSVIHTAGMYNFIGDERPEILIHQDVIKLGDIFYFTFLYKPNFTTAIENNYDIIPDEIIINQNYPNPFNSETEIKFDISEYANVSIKIYNVLGKEIAKLLESELSPGSYTLSWEAKDSNGKLLPSGVYLIRMITENYTKTIKALLLK
jgi:hypothetical protein